METDSPTNPVRQRVGLVYDRRMCEHSTPDGEFHPENGHRIKAIWKKLKSAGIPQRCVVMRAEEAEDKYIALVHKQSHVNLIKNISSTKFDSRREKIASNFNSVFLNKGSSEAAYLAAGAVIKVSEKVAKGELDSAVAIVRPPGHHAEVDEAMGFCLFNNVAVAASFLLNERPELGIHKILIVDWDVHHGNGTQKMFWEDSRVLYFSVHRFDSGKFFPFGNGGSHSMIGAGLGTGFNVNVPWEQEGCGDADYFAVWDHVLIPITKAFNPDMILISGGFDAAAGDPLGGCCVTPYGYSVLMKKLMEFAQGRIVMALEGGYSPDSLANSVLACVEALLEDKPIVGSSEGYPFESTWRVMQAVRKKLSTYWETLADELVLPKNLYRTIIKTSSVEAIHDALTPVTHAPSSSNRKDSKCMMAQKEESSTQRCYRFNFSSIFELMSDIRGKVTQAHLDEFKKTSFSGLFQMFYEEKWLNKTYFQKLNPSITTLIECYRKREDGFNIGPVTLKLEAEDIALIFGLKMEGEEVDPFSGRKDLFYRKTEFFKKYFQASSSATLSKRRIENDIRKVVGKVGEEEDFVKLMILEMACCFLFNSSSGSEIQSSFVEHLVDYKSINGISWPKTILKYLKERMLRQINGKTAAAGGCVVVLLYWIAEHVRIVDPIKGSKKRFPRAARWNLTEVARNLPEKLMTIRADEINEDFRGGVQEEESCLVQIGREEKVVPSIEVDETTSSEEDLNLEEEEAKSLLERNGKLKEENSELRERLNEVEDENKELLAKIVRLEELNRNQCQEIGIKDELLDKAAKQIEEMKDEMYVLPATSKIILEMGRDMQTNEVKTETNEEIQKDDDEQRPEESLAEEMKEKMDEETKKEEKQTVDPSSMVKRMKEKDRKKKTFDKKFIVEPVIKKPKKLVAIKNKEEKEEEKKVEDEDESATIEIVSSSDVWKCVKDNEKELIESHSGKQLTINTATTTQIAPYCSTSAQSATVIPPLSAQLPQSPVRSSPSAPATPAIDVDISISSPQAAISKKGPNTSNVGSFIPSNIPISTTTSHSSQSPQTERNSTFCTGRKTPEDPPPRKRSKTSNDGATNSNTTKPSKIDCVGDDTPFDPKFVVNGKTITYGDSGILDKDIASCWMNSVVLPKDAEEIKNLDDYSLTRFSQHTLYKGLCFTSELARRASVNESLVNTLTDDLKKEQEKVQKLEKSIMSLRTQVAAESSLKEFYLKEVGTLKMELANYEEDVDKLKNQISEQQGVINSKEAEVSKLNIEILNFQKEQKLLSMKCSSLEEQNTADQQRCKELEQRLCRINDMVSRICK